MTFEEFPFYDSWELESPVELRWWISFQLLCCWYFFPKDRSGIESNSKTRYLERNPEASAIQKPIENGLAWETTNKVGHFTDPCSPGEEKSSPIFGAGHKACGDALSSVEISGYEN